MEVSNYIKMRDQMQERFLTYDQKEIEGKYGFAFDDDYFYVPYLFEEWRVNRHTGVVEGSKDHFLHVHQGSFNETLTIFDLLCCGKKEIVLAGTYARTNSLKGPIKGRTIACPLAENHIPRETLLLFFMSFRFCRSSSSSGSPMRNSRRCSSLCGMKTSLIICGLRRCIT